MKTNQVLKSESRNLFGVQIRQQSKNGFLCLSDLQFAYNLEREANDWSERDIKEFFRYKENVERIYELLTEAKFINVGIHAFIDEVEDKGLINYLKELKLYEMKGRGEGRSVWANPYVFVAVALWMNPKIFAKTVIWLTDGLIVFRNLAGDNYKLMSNAVAEHIGNDKISFSIEARLINTVVAGKEKIDRNELSETDLKLISQCEKVNASFIQNGFKYPERYSKLKAFVELTRLSA